LTLYMQCELLRKLAVQAIEAAIVTKDQAGPMAFRVFVCGRCAGYVTLEFGSGYRAISKSKVN